MKLCGQVHAFSLHYTNINSFLPLCTDGVPHDGIPVEETVTVHISVTVLCVLLASAGVVFTVACLLFNFVFRNRKYVGFHICQLG